MDMGVIAALKKCYKYLLIKEILAYHDIPQSLKDRLALVSLKMKRGAAGIAYGKSSHLLDAANLVSIAWAAISEQCLSNCFKKADIIPSFRNVLEESPETDNTVNDIVGLFANSLSLDSAQDMAEIHSKVEKCLNDDDEQSDFYKNVVIEEIEEAMISALESKTEPAPRLPESEGEDTGNQIETIDQRNVIRSSLQKVVNMEILLSRLKESQYLSSQHVSQAKSALITLHCILQSGTSAVAQERNVNCHQMTLFDFM
ncbi:hypothetical protein R1flu_011797 [Riccia fluitans]|uniref:DDE-1 domain-containing protein n=1 Tax=Riccia fluitans TaxID=41844 RepID=A0ABD1Z9Q6_9MARC